MPPDEELIDHIEYAFLEGQISGLEADLAYHLIWKNAQICANWRNLECPYPEIFVGCGTNSLIFIFLNQLLTSGKWRRGGDSNPRYGTTVHSLSRRAP